MINSDDDTLEEYVDDTLEEYVFDFNESDFPPVSANDDFSDSDQEEHLEVISKYIQNNIKTENIIFAEKPISFFHMSEETKRELECRKKLSDGNECPMQIVANGNICYIIDNYISGKTLTDVITSNIKSPDNYSNQSILQQMRQIILAVKFVHDHGIIHGDLKPDNLIMAENGKKATVIDFGSAAIVGAHEELIDYTYHYVPPEYYHLAVEKKDLPVDLRIDIYALGIILWNCLSGGFDEIGMDERALNRNRSLQHGGFGRNTYRTDLDPGIDNPQVFNNWKLTQVAGKGDDQLKKEFDIMVRALKDDMQQLAKKFDSFGLEAGALLKNLIDSLLNKNPDLRPANCDVVLKKLDFVIATYNLSKAYGRLFQPAPLNVNEKSFVGNNHSPLAMKQINLNTSILRLLPI